ncbi:anti-repressor SinI family protein [Peribacillus sp. NPDC096540]|uniref:anti-repressor SinI family protein n=1 Tax=Peribacillus sp. NPDC096540 TaxID=3390612 RepID=UPI003CFF2A15
MNSIKQSQQEPLERMWIALMIEAKKSGITKEKVRKFLRQHQMNNAFDTDSQPQMDSMED